MAEHTRFNDVEGAAARGICESLLLAMTDSKLIIHRAIG